eukprot:GHVU01122998.1.p2 GENE.GHVU01122998.1~~GHVU01122998.1.p2  ORF type:complete len:143 (-),score=20.01 GHVU01122998.1:43-471(-)
MRPVKMRHAWQNHISLPLVYYCAAAAPSPQPQPPQPPQLQPQPSPSTPPPPPSPSPPQPPSSTTTITITTTTTIISIKQKMERRAALVALARAAPRRGPRCRCFPNPPTRRGPPRLPCRRFRQLDSSFGLASTNGAHRGTVA